MKTNLFMVDVFTFICFSFCAEDVSAESSHFKDNDKKNSTIEEPFKLNYEYRIYMDLNNLMELEELKDVSNYYRFISYVKNSLIIKKNGNFSLTTSISVTPFNVYEKFWNHSGIMKSLFGSCENSGIHASYNFTRWVSADAIFINTGNFDVVNCGIGVTFNPINGLQMRFSTRFNDSALDDKTGTIFMSAFLGYKSDRFTLGAEYNYTINSSFTLGKDKVGYSIFASVKLAKFADLYTRYDEHYSGENNIFSNNEQSAVVGLEFKITEKIKLSPNFKMDFSNTSGLANNYFACLNCNLMF